MPDPGAARPPDPERDPRTVPPGDPPTAPLADRPAAVGWRGAWVPIDDEAVASPPPDRIVAEMPVAIAINGDPYAVMMVTPADLSDFALGFALAEGLIDDPSDLLDLCLSPYREPGAEGVSAHLTVRQACLERLDGRRRATVGTVACGLCGTAEIGGALRPLPTTATPFVPAAAALSAGLAGLADGTLGRSTRAAHAALILDRAGLPLALREDAGRHTALDKAIGAWAALDRPGPAFALLTSRCSVELVQKAVTAGLSALVNLGAPTALAVETATATGLPLLTRLGPAGAWRVA